ncbi:hypothetical protein ACVOMV_28560 [Mesorhizobium atlanticum]
MRAAFGMLESCRRIPVPVLADFQVKIGNSDLQKLWLGWQGRR